MKYYREAFNERGEWAMYCFDSLDHAKGLKGLGPTGRGPIYEVVAIHEQKTVSTTVWADRLPVGGER